ncbi:aldose 1-epimerase [Halocynthiibacter sp. C4]|uniref:aldose 1-epimerase n=1 Tax=Halocynthiibacter sp. C4 TaxID=2992758 RepID=UPI00237ACC1B|nr:aldose 1-epimerase [Halocynthiibacter sp. C4]MDE0589149.1 aldose 1-epimerase [Halocynthiibacter sp. C4]
MEFVTLENKTTKLVVAPELGGGIASFDAKTGAGAMPVLRPLADGATEPFDLASNILVPFSNRISNGGFDFDGRFWELEPNLKGQTFPIHGDGFQKPWGVQSTSDLSAELRLQNGEIGPFRYSARAGFELEDRMLTHWIEVTNNGPRLPFGGGFHPWFPRRADTTLQFNAETVWLEDEQHLPVEEVPLSQAKDFDYAASRALPKGLINAAFTGWQRVAQICQPSLGLDIWVTANSSLDTALVFSPNDQSDFFCFEPVSHAVDAHNQRGKPGLAVLETGETKRLAMKIAWVEHGRLPDFTQLMSDF